jgi:thiamine-phosphate pyrophosphorylase
MFSDRSGLYAIVDADALAGRDPLAFAEALLTAGPLFALQLRAKRWPARQTLAVARALKERCGRAGVPFVVNDRPDVAVLCGADAVHVGQDDLSIADVRALAPGALVGRSTHELAQLRAALDERPGYVAFGPVFSTRSKEAPDPTVGLESLSLAARSAESEGVPLVAIGGITLENARAVREAGARSAAVIGALSALADDRPALCALAHALHGSLAR